MPPVVDLCVVAVFPQHVFGGLLLPEHEIHLHLLDERKADVLSDPHPLAIADAVLADDDEVSQQAGSVVQLVQHLRVDFPEDQSVLPEVVPNGVVHVGYLGDVVLLLLWVVELLP